MMEDDRFHFIKEGNFFCLEISLVTLQDAGRWTCSAENQSGRASSSSHLNVIGNKNVNVFKL